MSTRRKRSLLDFIDEYFDDLEEWAEQVRETLSERPCWDLKTCAIEPLHELRATPREVVVTVDLPYAKKNTVKVKPLGAASLEITAEMRREIPLDEIGVYHCKGSIQRFHGHIRIPVPVSMEKMKTQQKKEILEIHLPRKH